MALVNRLLSFFMSTNQNWELRKIYKMKRSRLCEMDGDGSRSGGPRAALL